TITDADAGQSSFAPQANAAGLYGTFTLDAFGNWTYTANDSQAAIEQLNTGQFITDSFTAVSSDGTNSQVVTVKINGTTEFIDTEPPQFSDTISVPNTPGLWAFTGNKSNAGPGNIWTFKVSVTDDDAIVIGQAGITQFDLIDNGAVLGSATFNGSTWTVSGLISSFT